MTTVLESMIEDIMKYRGFKSKNEFIEYMHRKYGDLRKKTSAEIFDIVLKEFLESVKEISK